MIHHCVQECMPVNAPSKCICVISLLLTDNKGAITFQSSYFPQLVLVNIIAPLLSVRRREITQVHLLGTLTGMHSRTQWCITNEKSLGPFRPWRPAGLNFQARPAAAAGHPARCISTPYTVRVRSTRTVLLS